MKIRTFDMVVFSHLRWEFVTQRPQHIVARIAKKQNILFVEEPVDGPTRIFSPQKNITVIQTHAPAIDSPLFKRIVTAFINTHNSSLSTDDPILWFYSSSFVALIEEIPHALIVYDCMDELSLFRGAPASLIKQEQKLLWCADIVFTGGKSLYEAKRKLHPNVYCFPSSVDSNHFQKALLESTTIPEEIASLPHPVAGYIGVIDERIDTTLVGKIASSLPDVSFVMIGPVVKIDSSSLPQLENLHYLGGKPYNMLPNYLKGIDIAFMPFALNDATRFISPTKTLEFIAAQKPIISTSVYDVVRDYNQAIKIVGGEQQMKDAISEISLETEEDKKRRKSEYTRILNNTSWEKTVLSMEKIIRTERENEDLFYLENILGKQLDIETVNLSSLNSIQRLNDTEIN